MSKVGVVWYGRGVTMCCQDKDPSIQNPTVVDGSMRGPIGSASTLHTVGGVALTVTR